MPPCGKNFVFEVKESMPPSRHRQGVIMNGGQTAINRPAHVETSLPAGGF
jgi:hypothetical protein